MKENKTRKVTFRFTQAEFLELEKKYKRTTSRKLSDYIRKVLLGKPVTVVHRNKSMDEFMEELIRLRKDLNAVGNNFNQIVKKINSVGDDSLKKVWLPFAEGIQNELVERIKEIQNRINQFTNQWLPK